MHGAGNPLDFPLQCPGLAQERAGGGLGWGWGPADPIWPGTVVLSSAPTSFLAVVFPQDLLEKGLEADNFAMLGLGDIVIPGEDTRGRTSPGLSETATGSPPRQGDHSLCCAFGCAGAPPASHRGWELCGWVPEPPPGLPLGSGPCRCCPGATRGHCEPRHGRGWLKALPSSASILSFSLQGSSSPCCCALTSGEGVVGKGPAQPGSCSVLRLLL